MKKLNLPIITKVIFNHNISEFPSAKAAHAQAHPVATSVVQNNHFLPIFNMTHIAIAIAGISTKPARACYIREK